MTRKITRRALFATAGGLIVETGDRLGAQDSVYLTNGMPNGTLWRDMDETNRTVMMMGIQGGLYIGYVMNDKTKRADTVMDRYGVSKGQLKEVLRRLDLFYAEAKNQVQPVPDAYISVMARLMEPAVLEDEIKQGFRRMQDLIEKSSDDDSPKPTILKRGK